MSDDPFGELRSALHQPGWKSWMALLRALEDAHDILERQAMVDYCTHLLARWPDDMERPALDAWVARLIDGHDEPALALCNTLELSPSLYGSLVLETSTTTRPRDELVLSHARIASIQHLTLHPGALTRQGLLALARNAHTDNLLSIDLHYALDPRARELSRLLASTHLAQTRTLVLRSERPFDLTPIARASGLVNLRRLDLSHASLFEGTMYAQVPTGSTAYLAAVGQDSPLEQLRELDLRSRTAHPHDWNIGWHEQWNPRDQLHVLRLNAHGIDPDDLMTLLAGQTQLTELVLESISEGFVDVFLEILAGHTHLAQLRVLGLTHCTLRPDQVADLHLLLPSLERIEGHRLATA